MAAAVVTVPTLLSALPAAASPGTSPQGQPTIESVQRQLNQLVLQNSQLVEQYNQARVVATQRQTEAARSARAARAAQAAFDAASVEMTHTIAVQYEGSDLPSAAALLTSPDGQAYLDRLDAENLIATHDAQVVSDLTTSRAKAQQASAAAQRLLDQARAELTKADRARAAVEQQIAKYKATLALLDAKQQQAFAQAINPAARTAAIGYIAQHVGGTKPEQTAVRFALAQVGKPYVFGAAGPDAYDCSGLTMASWAAAGVSLPHSAADQYNYGHHVGLDQLSPGDLIFMYSPIGHVTIYIGQGLMVSAPTEGEPVTVVPVSSFSSDIVGATHLG
ncbi:MAG: C40 family peptidase [Jatrophihabitans sp.]|uniref:C40 family peptidase n=1 Tax=Jatrophihabitans sp. TaxID=1932789 RepID=UPI003F80E071